jgi:hypothetical protein
VSRSNHVSISIRNECPTLRPNICHHYSQRQWRFTFQLMWLNYKYHIIVAIAIILSVIMVFSNVNV